MKGTHQVCLIAFIAIIFAAFLSVPDALSEDNTCRIKTGGPYLFVNVYDVFPNENPGKLIWQGELKQNQQVLLTSTYGRFYYNYSTDPESNTAMISGIVRFCKDGEIHNLP